MGGLFHRGKWAGRETIHSPPTSAEIKKMGVHTSSWCNASLVDNMGNFTFHLQIFPSRYDVAYCVQKIVDGMSSSGNDVDHYVIIRKLYVLFLTDIRNEKWSTLYVTLNKLCFCPSVLPI
jgi:hypothetical protein